MGINSKTWLKIISLSWLSTRWKRNLILHMMENFFVENYNFPGLATNFQGCANLQKFSFSSIIMDRCIALSWLSAQWKQNSILHMMEKKKIENCSFQRQGQNFQIWANLHKSNILFII